MKRVLIYLFLILLVPALAFAAQRITLQTGAGAEVGTSGNPLQVSVSGDVETGTGSIDGTSGINFDPDNDGVDETTMDTDGGLSIGGTLLVTVSGTMGWTTQDQVNQACSTTCTRACVFGFNTAGPNIVDCGDASADECLCAGGS